MSVTTKPGKHKGQTVEVAFVQTKTFNAHVGVEGSAQDYSPESSICSCVYSM